MHAETVRVSNCINSFSIRMKGGSDDGFDTTDNTFNYGDQNQAPLHLLIRTKLAIVLKVGSTPYYVLDIMTKLIREIVD